MNVVILNQTFYPDIAATAQLMWDLAGHLADRGHGVAAIASNVVYGTGHHFAQTYEQHGRIEIHRVAQTNFGKTRMLGRACDAMSYYASSLLRLLQMRPPDVILALTSPPMISALGVLVRRLRPRRAGGRTALVCHVMDLYPEAAIATGVLGERSLWTRILRRATADTLRAADAVITVGRDMRELIQHNYPNAVRRGRMHVVHPWADGRAIHPIGKRGNELARCLGLTQTFNVVYSGNLGLGHDLETMVGAIRAMRDERDLRFLFVGGGARFGELQSLASAESWQHVRFLPYQPRQSLNEALNVADVHLVSQRPQFTGIVVPSKLFGVMAAGVPTIMIGPADAECSRIIVRHQAGVVVANQAVDGVVAAIRAMRDRPGLREEMGRNARQAFIAHYDRAIACDRIESILRQTINGTGAIVIG